MNKKGKLRAIPAFIRVPGKQLERVKVWGLCTEQHHVLLSNLLSCGTQHRRIKGSQSKAVSLHPDACALCPSLSLLPLHCLCGSSIGGLLSWLHSRSSHPELEKSAGCGAVLGLPRVLSARRYLMEIMAWCALQGGLTGGQG